MDQLNRKTNHKYQYVGFLPSTVRIKENGFWGINDFEGNEILPSNYIEVYTLSSGYGLIAARDAGFWDIYDFFGNKINNQSYDSLYPYYGLFGMTAVKVGKKWGLTNKFGKLIIPIKYKRIERFGKGLILHAIDAENEFIERDEIINLAAISSIPELKRVKQPVQKIIKNPAFKKKTTF